MPLDGLIHEQAAKLKQAAFEAIIVSSGNNAVSAIVDDKISHVLLSPEALVAHFIPAAKKHW